MTKPRPPRPVESFGPEIFQALIEGSKRKIEIQLPYNKAIYFRMRANQLRNRMRAEGHPQYSAASQARITISWPPDTTVRRSTKGVRVPIDQNTLCTLIIAPSDSEFTEILARAGVSVPSLHSDIPSSSPHEDDILAEFLKK